jgi:hypothetical protein
MAVGRVLHRAVGWRGWFVRRARVHALGNRCLSFWPPTRQNEWRGTMHAPSRRVRATLCAPAVSVSEESSSAGSREVRLPHTNARVLAKCPKFSSE